MTNTTQLIFDELRRRGIDVDSRQLKDSSVHTFTYGGKTRRIVGSVPDITNGIVQRIADDKSLTHEVLGQDGKTEQYLLPTEVFLSDDQALAFLQQQKCIVVKPIDGSHGNGVTVDVKTIDALKKAVIVAQRASLSGMAMLQRQAIGKDIRVLVVDGEVVAVAMREPASVVGDGVHTIGQLITLENDNNPDRHEVAYSGKLNYIDITAAHNYLAENISRVPNKGEVVQVVGTANIGTGGKAYEYMSAIPDELKAFSVQVAQQFGAFICAVDVMYDETSGEFWLLEINASPSFMLHVQPSVGAPIDVTKLFIDRLLARYDDELPDVIGVSSLVDFVGYKNLKDIPARIDTGARTSSLWASDIKEKKGTVTFKLFDVGSPWYTGKVVRRKVLQMREVTSSTGNTQVRYLVEMTIQMKGKKLKSKFTLSNRSTQTFPILIGRNTLRGNFLVDSGNPGEAKLYKHPEEADEFNESEAV